MSIALPHNMQSNSGQKIQIIEVSPSGSSEDIGFGWLDSTILDNHLTEIFRSLENVAAELGSTSIESPILSSPSSQKTENTMTETRPTLPSEGISVPETTKIIDGSVITSELKKKRRMSSARKRVQTRVMDSVNRHIRRNSVLKRLFSSAGQTADANEDTSEISASMVSKSQTQLSTASSDNVFLPDSPASMRHINLDQPQRLRSLRRLVFRTPASPVPRLPGFAKSPIRGKSPGVFAPRNHLTTPEVGGMFRFPSVASQKNSPILDHPGVPSLVLHPPNLFSPVARSNNLSLHTASVHSPRQLENLRVPAGSSLLNIISGPLPLNINGNGVLSSEGSDSQNSSTESLLLAVARNHPDINICETAINISDSD